jgi:hypothetical protein
MFNLTRFTVLEEDPAPAEPGTYPDDRVGISLAYPQCPSTSVSFSYLRPHRHTVMQ